MYFYWLFFLVLTLHYVQRCLRKLKIKFPFADFVIFHLSNIDFSPPLAHLMEVEISAHFLGGWGWGGVFPSDLCAVIIVHQPASALRGLPS